MSNITHISGSLNSIAWENMNNINPEAYVMQSQDAHSVHVPVDTVDTTTGVQTRSKIQPTLIADEDVDRVLAETMQNITSDPYSAMYAHNGLDAARVAALLA